MTTLLLGHRNNAHHKLKRSFFASLALHAGILLALLVVSAIPHKFHFEQTALIELQGISATKGGTGAGDAAAVNPSTAPRQAKAPKAAALKSTAKISHAPPKTQIAPEKISLKPSKKSLEKMRAPEVDLKERILQKFQQIPPVASPAAAVAGEAGMTGSESSPQVAGIGTDVPFPFANYLADVRDRITDLWEQPSLLSSAAQGAQAVVVFRIQRSGNVARVLLTISSGITALDRSAVQAVESANPLPPLPPEFKDDFLDVHLQFDLTR